jgi:hypothetical protein
MDAVITGIIGGGTASLLVVIGGMVAVSSNLWETYSSPKLLFIWLIVLSALVVGQLFLTYTISTTFSEVTPQVINLK